MHAPCRSGESLAFTTFISALAKVAKRDCAVPVSCQNGENGVSIVRLNELEAAGMYQAELEGRLHLALSAAAKADGLRASNASDVPMGCQTHMDCWDFGVQTNPTHYEEELAFLTHETYHLRRMLLDRGVSPKLLIAPGKWFQLKPSTKPNAMLTTQRTPAHRLSQQSQPLMM